MHDIRLGQSVGLLRCLELCNGSRGELESLAGVGLCDLFKGLWASRVRGALLSADPTPIAPAVLARPEKKTVNIVANDTVSQ